IYQLKFTEQTGTTVADSSPTPKGNANFIGCPLWWSCTTNCANLNCQSGSTCTSVNDAQITGTWDGVNCSSNCNTNLHYGLLCDQNTTCLTNSNYCQNGG